MNTLGPRLLAIAAILALPGCMSLRAYDGKKLSGDSVAVVKGDYKVRAGAPLSLLLRKADEYPIDVRYSAVELLPGVHTLLIDCQINGSVSRYSIEAELEAGVKYRIVGESGSGNRECQNVRLNALN